MRSAIYRRKGAPTDDHGLERSGPLEKVGLLRIGLNELQSEAGFIEVSVRPGRHHWSQDRPFSALARGLERQELPS